MKRWLSLFLFGAAGALCRQLISIGTQHFYPYGTESFPWSTWICNIIGCGVLGYLTGKFLTDRSSLWLREGLTVGLIGAFTTFSAFSMETFVLMEHNRYDMAVLYSGSSFIAGWTCTYFGIRWGTPGKNASHAD
ncbi:fluoride efflux transporter FluC [Paenibacillus swuensis]|uniref:fluoride efflux transporter FluC n=1 Tax=Paenibacillus swuensis TaxID=1178515 RepID=UPI0018D3C6E6